MTAVPETPTPEPAGAGFFERNKLWLIAIAVFAVSHLGAWWYQRHQHGKLVEESRAVLDRNLQRAQDLSDNRDEEVALNLCRTMAFGIGAEMERGNKADIEVFINSMVQESGLDLVIVQNAQDSIFLSTDKKYENQKVPYVQQGLTGIKVLESKPGEVAVASPIMGAERRLGTLLVVYKAPDAAMTILQQMRQDSLAAERKQ